MPKRLYFIATFFLLIASFGISIFAYTIIKKNLNGGILGLTETGTVNVTTTVKTNTIYFKVYPERRIPAINNWSNNYSVSIQNCTTNQTTTFTNVNTLANGIGTLDSSSDDISNGQYSFIVRGNSDLTKKFDCTSIDSIEANVDLTINNQVLKAGEISSVFDNYINSLDLGAMMGDFRSNTLKSDLNRDGQVNSLDLSNLVDNLFVAGD